MTLTETIASRCSPGRSICRFHLIGEHRARCFANFGDELKRDTPLRELSLNGSHKLFEYLVSCCMTPYVVD